MAQAKITDAECVSALRAIAEHGTKTAAARALGIDVTAVRRWAAEGLKRGLTPASAVRTEADRLKEKVRLLESDVKRLQQEEETTATIRERVFGLAARVPEPAPWLDRNIAAGDAAEIPVLFCSDWHWGEVVNPVEMAGTNAFNSVIARQRAELLFDTAHYLIERDTGKTRPEGVVVVLGGDLITGTIHDELAETNDRTTTQAINELTDVLIAGLEKTADRFGHVFVPGVVGNHGRNTTRPRFKQAAYTSYEWLMYQTLERHFRRDSRFVFFIPGETDAFFCINGKRFLLTHGDKLGVKGGDGIIGAIGPILRGTFKLGRSEGTIGRDFDFLMMGHYHYPLYLPTTIVNGALKGYDEFARLALRVPYAPASQMLFRVHPKFGLTTRREIILQDPFEAAKEVEWITWPRIG